MDATTLSTSLTGLCVEGVCSEVGAKEGEEIGTTDCEEKGTVEGEEDTSTLEGEDAGEDPALEDFFVSDFVKRDGNSFTLSMPEDESELVPSSESSPLCRKTQND